MYFRFPSLRLCYVQRNRPIPSVTFVLDYHFVCLFGNRTWSLRNFWWRISKLCWSNAFFPYFCLCLMMMNSYTLVKLNVYFRVVTPATIRFSSHINLKWRSYLFHHTRVMARWKQKNKATKNIADIEPSENCKTHLCNGHEKNRHTLKNKQF